MHQTILPILPDPMPVGRPDLEAEALRSPSGVEYHELGVRQILNRCASPRLPFQWTINPYRGCEFACTYCYARYTHRFFELWRWQDFERKIFVKRGAAAALNRSLRKLALLGQPIAIGTATDPYQPAERHHKVTRALLETFLQAEGLEISVATKSPLILRDLDLLTELDKRNSITVQLSLTTVDPRLARRVELHAPDPAARLRALRSLSEEGIATSVLCMPIMPAINDGAEVLGPLLEQLRIAGAMDVVAEPLSLRPAARARFWPWLAAEFPHLLQRYRKLYGRRDYLTRAQQERLLNCFRRLRLEQGFPRGLSGRG